MADRLGLLDDLQLRLVVVEAARIRLLAAGSRIRGTGRPALVEQELRELQILLVAGDAIQPTSPISVI